MTRLICTEIATGKEKYFNSINEAAEELHINHKTLSKWLNKTGSYTGYKFKRVRKRKRKEQLEVEYPQIVFEEWMIEYIKVNYTGEASISDIASTIRKREERVRQKIQELGIQPKKLPEETDPNMIDYKNYVDRIEALKEKLKKGIKVKVQYFNDDLSEDGMRAKKEVEATVDGIYSTFANVRINGVHHCYRYEEILEVAEA